MRACLGLEVLGEQIDPLGDPSCQRLLQGPRIHSQEPRRSGRRQRSDVVLHRELLSVAVCMCHPTSVRYAIASHAKPTVAIHLLPPFPAVKKRSMAR